MPDPKETQDTAEEPRDVAPEAEAVKDTETPDQGEQVDDALSSKLSKKEMDALKLSAIEAVEVAPSEQDDVSQDPDVEVKIIPHDKRESAPWWTRRKVMIPVGIASVVLLLLLIPWTRYTLLGWAWHRDMTVVVQDSNTAAAVAGATVTIGSHSAVTDSSGKAVVPDVPLGYYTIAVQKKYYGDKQQSVAVDILPLGQTTVAVRAIGTITHLKVTDRLTNKPVSDAVVASADVTFGKTNTGGDIDVVIPKGKKELTMTVTSSRYNVLKTTITSKTRSVDLIPAGTTYVLKKQDGRLNVVKMNYDGSDSKVIVPGTGDESDTTTLLVASTDWQYMVLRAKRAPNKPENLYAISTKDDKYAVIDDESAQFTAIGWIGHTFIYQSTRQGNDQWREKSTLLKSYNAETGKTIVLDENASDPASSDGAALYETIGAQTLAGGLVTYAKVWTTLGEKTISSDGKQSKIISVKPDGSEQKVLKSIAATDVTEVDARNGIPDTTYYTLTTKSGKVYGEFSQGTYKDMADGSAAVRQYPAYVISPSGSKTIWSEKKGDTYTIYLGDKSAGNKQELITGSSYQPYAWLSDDRLIVQKADTELYVTTLDQLKQGRQLLKMSDYFRIDNTAVGGYGVR